MTFESYFHAPCWLCVRASALQNYTIFDFILLAVALFLLPVQSVITGRKLAVAETSQRALLRRYALTLFRGAAIAVYVIALWRWSGRSFGLLGLRAPTDLRSQAGFILDIVVAAVFTFQHLRLKNFSPQTVAKLQEAFKSKRIVPRNRAEFSLFSAVALIGSVWEELLFRGFLIWFFSAIVGLAGAIVCSVIVFGLAHAYQGWRNILRTALMGAVFAVGYVATRSLWWVIVAHAIMNIMGGLFGLRVARLAARTSDTPA
ncbi:MAG: CPBP family intramembrane glutamic endopeptidase [Rhizomicrobium sp.]